MIRKIILLLYLPCQCLAQAPVKLSKYEKFWALLHPLAALKIQHLQERVSIIYLATPVSALDGYTSGGRLDAYRHVFFMAAFAQKIGVRKLRKLGLAHEKANYRQFRHAAREEGEIPDSLSSVMDLQNNELGFKLGRKNKKAKLEDLKDITILHIQKGEAWILKRDKSGAYLDCTGKRLSVSSYKHWGIPKCLVASDYVYKD